MGDSNTFLGPFRPEIKIPIKSTNRLMESQKKSKDDYENQHKINFFDAIYGKTDISQRIESFSARGSRKSFKSNPTGTLSEKKSVPSFPIHFNKAVFDVENCPKKHQKKELRPATTSNFQIRGKYSGRRILNKNSGISEIKKAQNEPSPRLRVYSSRNTSSQRPKSPLNSNDFIKSQIIIEEKTNPILNNNYPLAPIISLHYFDDESYDPPNFSDICNNLHINPQLGYSQYSLNSNILEWKKCIITGYKNKLFEIKFCDSENIKHVYRTSLRFDFEDIKRFDERREKALKWRSEIESQLKLFSDLTYQSQIIHSLPDPSIMNLITSCIPNKKGKGKHYTHLIQEVIQLYQFADQFGQYILDCQDPKLREKFIEKGYPIINFDETNYREISNGLQIPNCHFHSPHSLQSLKLLLNKFEKDSLYCPIKRIPNIKNLNYFDFCTLHQQYINSRIKIFNETIILPYTTQTISIAGKAQLWYENQELSDQNNEEETNIQNDKNDFSKRDAAFRMCNFLLMDSLEDYCSKSIKDLYDEMVTSHVHFRVIITKDLKIDSPTRSELLNASKRLFLQLRDAFVDKIDFISISNKNHKKIHVNLNAINPTYEEYLNKWSELINNDYDQLELALKTISEFVSPIPTRSLDTFNTENYDESSANWKSMKLSDLLNKIKCSQQRTLQFLDQYSIPLVFGHLLVNLDEFTEYIISKNDLFKQKGCEFVVHKIEENLITIDQQINELKDKCSYSPSTIEEFDIKQNLLAKLKQNFEPINIQIDSTFSLFDFLEELLDDSKLQISNAYRMKIDLKHLLDNLPIFQKQEKEDYDRLMEVHMNEIKSIQEDIKDLNSFMNDLYFKVDLTQSEIYRSSLESYRTRLESLQERRIISQNHDKILKIKVTDFWALKHIEYCLSLFIPLWEIVHFFDSQVEDWMSLPFPELSPANIINEVTMREEKLKEIYSAFLSDGVIPCDRSKSEAVQSDNNFKEPEKIENVIDLTEHLQVLIHELINHIPIIQLFCNPSLRSRHWKSIAEITGKYVDKNDGVTWQWIIESGFEQFTPQISDISFIADQEYKVEKALYKMTEDLHTCSLDLTTNNNGISMIKDTTKVFNMLLTHQKLIQENWIPPYVKPFNQKIKEYETLTKNLRVILSKSLETQSSIGDIAPAMESEDLKSSAKLVTNSFDESKFEYNSLIEKFGNGESLYELISRPRYGKIVDKLRGSIQNLKGQLKQILESKRKTYPYFRLLSDSQLIDILSNSHIPSKISYIFGNIFPNIKMALFSEDNKECLGFIGKEGETVYFEKSFKVTPHSIEKLFQNFETNVTLTLRTSLANLLTQGVISTSNLISKVDFQNIPTQIIILYMEIVFSARVQKILDTSVQTCPPISQFAYLSSSIQSEIDAICVRASFKATRKLLNVIAACSRHLEILDDLSKEKDINTHSYCWTRRFKYFILMNGIPNLNFLSQQNSLSFINEKIDSYQVTLSFGPTSYAYDFSYTGENLFFLTNKEIENILLTMLIHNNNNINTVVLGTTFSGKSTLIKYFSQLLGKNIYDYSCSSHVSSSTLSYLIETSFLTESLLILKEIQNVNDFTLAELSPLLIPSPKNKNTSIPIFSTYSLMSKSETTAKPYIYLHFRPISLSLKNDEKDPIYMNSVIRLFKVALIGNGCDDSDIIAPKLAALYQKFTNDNTSPYYSIFSILNIIQTLMNESLNPENIEYDIYKRFQKQIIQISNDKCEKIKALEFIRSIFRISETISALPLRTCKDYFKLALRQSRDIIILGNPSCGKSTLIEKISNEKQIRVQWINPMAQKIDFINDFNSNELISNSSSNNNNDLNSAQWIVFDGLFDHELMTILSMENLKHDELFFFNGSFIHLQKDFHFLFETDSVAMATPSLLAHCSIVFVPDDYVEQNSFLQTFLTQLKNERRLTEPLSNTIIGTHIPVDNLLQIIIDFVQTVVFHLLQSTSSLKFLCSKNYLLSNFFNVLYTLLDVHYIQQFNLPEFKQPKRSSIIETILPICVFATIWSFGAIYQDKDRPIFETAFRKLLPNFSFPDQKSLFEHFYDPYTNKWKVWDDFNPQSFFSPSLEIEEVIPNLSILTPSTYYPVLYWSDCFLSQTHPILLNSSSSFVRKVLTQAMINTQYSSLHYAPLLYNYENSLTSDSLRQIFDDSLGGIRNGTRSALRLPLLAFYSIEPYVNSFTEFLRFSIDRQCIINLETISFELTQGIGYILTSDISSHNDSFNLRLLNHFSIITIPQFDENTIIKMISTYFSVHFANTGISLKSFEKISTILNKYIINQKSPNPAFNKKHLFYFIQRLSKVMQNQDQNLFGNAFVSEAISVFFDSMPTEDTLACLNIMFREISHEINKNIPISMDISNNSILFNYKSTEYQFVPPLKENTTQTSENVLEIVKEKYSMDNKNSMDLLKIARILTTPRTNILLVTDLVEYAINIIKNTTDFIGINYVEFSNMKNLSDVLPEYLFQAGKSGKNQALIINLNTITKNDLSLIEKFVNDYNTYGIFNSTQINQSLQEIYSQTDEEDPFREETLESRDNYNILASNFLAKCYSLLHICLICPPSFSSIESLEKHCSTIILPNQPVFILNKYINEKTTLEQTLKQDTTSLFTLPLIIQLISKISEKLSFHSGNELLSIIRSFSERLSDSYQKYLKKESLLSTLDEIASDTNQRIQNNLSYQQKMEKEVQELAQTMDVLVSKAKDAEESAKRTRQSCAEEEKELQIQTKEANILREESQKALSKVLPQVQQALNELKNLSIRDVAVIKSMNHPPRGVYLVVKALTVLFRIHCEDKEGIENGQQQSWIEGRKLLSDNNIINKLIQIASKPLPNDVMNGLKSFLDDPNFTPSNVAASSSAAKSICKCVRSIVPYSIVSETLSDKQQALKKYEHDLQILQEKHSIALQKLGEADREVKSIELKVHDLKEKKESLEERLELNKIHLAQSRETMHLMNDVFSMWQSEHKELLKEHSINQTSILFTSIILGLFSFSQTSERDKIFNTVINTFIDILSQPSLKQDINNEIIDANIEFMKQMKRDNFRDLINFLLPEKTIPEYLGVKLPNEYIENEALIFMDSKQWLYISDPNDMVYGLIKKQTNKRISYISYKSSEFLYELQTAIQRNDFISIFDYDASLNDPLFYKIWESRGKTSENGIMIYDLRTLIPSSLQIAFIEKTPEYMNYDAVFVDFQINENFMEGYIASLLFSVFESDASHEIEGIISSKSEIENELQKEKDETQKYAYSTKSKDILNDENCIKNFQKLMNTSFRVKIQSDKLDQKLKNIQTIFSRYLEKSKQFIQIYNSSPIKLTFDHFIQLFKDSLMSIPHEISVNKAFDYVVSNLTTRVDQVYAMSLPYEDKINHLFTNLNNSDIFKLSEQKSYISHPNDELRGKLEQIGMERLYSPKTLNELHNVTSSRRPALIGFNSAIFKAITSSGKAIFTPLSQCSKSFIFAQENGKMLFTLCPSGDLFNYLISVIGNMRSLPSLSNEFRFIIMTSDIPINFSVSYDFGKYCDRFGMETGHFSGSIAAKMASIMQTVPYTKMSKILDIPSPKAQRLSLLFAFFDSYAITCDPSRRKILDFNDSNFKLLIDVFEECPHLGSLFDFAFNNFYIPFFTVFSCTDQQKEKWRKTLKNIWDGVLSEKNREPVVLHIFEEYRFPNGISNEILEEMFNAFPISDQFKYVM